MTGPQMDEIVKELEALKLENKKLKSGSDMLLEKLQRFRTMTDFLAFTPHIDTSTPDTQDE